MGRKQNVTAAAVVAIIIGTVAWYGYSSEQIRQSGFAFGNELLAIQEGVRDQQSEFSSHVILMEEGDLTEQEFADFAEAHFGRMAKFIDEYDALDPPDTFEASVQVFKLSSEAQLESDMQYLLWIQTGDEAHLIRSDALIQDAFEYETAALGEFNRAKSGMVQP